MKKVWEIVADEMTQRFKIKISCGKCENRFKTLERNYKKVLDNNNRTGQGRKVFEYQR
nr:unnamed protein product [Callosobruchus chinensis]